MSEYAESVKVKEVRAVETRNMVKQREVQANEQELFEVENEQSSVRRRLRGGR